MEELTGRILILDDEKGMCKSLSVLLAHRGHEVVTAGTVMAGIQNLTDKYFDLVVTDLVFPDGNGRAVMDYCKAHCPKTKVIAMTGHASLDSAIEALRHGAFDYVIKPFDFGLFEHVVMRALEHQKMVDEIQYSKQRYQSLVEDLNDGYFVLKDGRVVHANRTMARMLCCDMSQLIGCRFSDLVHMPENRRFEAHRQLLEAGSDTSYLEEVSLKDFLGHTRSVELKLSASTAEGKGGAVVGICRDITDRKLLWDKLIKSERLALMGEMVAGIAHELNNRLTPVLGYTEMVLKMDLGEDVKRRLCTVLSATIGAKSIVESLLLFARQEKPQRALCDANQIVAAAVDLVSSSFSGAEVDLLLGLAPALPPVMADAHQIEQVIANILKNAYEVLPNGGTIAVKTMESGGHVMISVSDSGPGIAPHLKAHIFDPFFTTKERGRGTGLGLSICHGIIREHGGDLDVCTEPGKGTTFTIMLAASPAADAAEKDVPGFAPDNFGSRGRRILLVEDELEIADLLREILSGFETAHAENGAQALDFLEKGAFDLIISDVRMPGIDGIALYEHLMEGSPEYCQKIVYTTGVIFDQRTQNFFRKTGVPYLRKPFKVQQILDLVHQNLEAGRKEDPARAAI